MRGITVFWMLNGGAAYNDPDVVSYLNRQSAAGTVLTDAQKSAYARLVAALKTANAWTDLIEGAPQLGGTAAAHAILMKGGAALFVGSPTQNSTGTLLNGTTQYIKTGIIASVALSNNSYCFMYYSGASTGFGSPEHVMGAYDSNSAYLALTARDSGGSALFYASSSTSGLSIANVDGSQLITGNRYSATDALIARNTTTLLSSSTANTGTLPNREIYVGALNNGGSPGFYTNKPCKGWFIFKGLSATKLLAAQQAIINYETDLGRV